MFIPSRIDELLNTKKSLTKKTFCEKIGISVTGLDNVLNKGTELGAFRMERIADYFKVPIDYFFDREVELPKHGVTISGDGNKVQHGNGNVMIEQAKEIDHLKELLEEKERTIQILLKQK